MSLQTIRSRIIAPIGRPPIENGALILDGSSIRAVSRWKDLALTRPNPVADLGETILLPGFINCHCHLDYTALAGKIPSPRGFADWLQSLIALKASWSRAQWTASWLAGAHMLEQSGVTAVVNIEAAAEKLPELWQATPLRLFSCLELIDVRTPGAAKSIVEAAIQKSRAFESQHPNRCGLSPHALYTATDDLLLRAQAAAQLESRLLTTHIAESSEEDAMYQSAAGPLHQWLQAQGQTAPHCGEGSPVAILDRLGYFRAPVIAAHANYLAPADERILAEHNVTVAHCPRSHRYFGHAPFPWQRLRAAGVNIVLGTDSLASTEQTGENAARLDFFAELACLAAQDNAPAPHEILQCATVNAARAIRRKRELGQLAPGFLADLIAIPYTGKMENLAEAVIHHRGNVAASMIRGRRLPITGHRPPVTQ